MRGPGAEGEAEAAAEAGAGGGGAVKPAPPLTGCRILDVGCGGGILTEPLCRLGARVTGIDAAEASIEGARRHALLDARVAERATYAVTTVEDLAATGVQFDTVVASEVIEHVSDVPAFVGACKALVRPGGALVVTTISRTPKSYALAIAMAEHVLRIVPPGTHDWSRFITPMELGDLVRAGAAPDGEATDVATGTATDAGGLDAAAAAGPAFRVERVSGLFYNPVCSQWSIISDTDVNYALVARRSSR